MKRVKKNYENPNPLFEKWLEEFKRQAELEDKQSRFGLSNALKSLKKYPVPLNSGEECKILKHFGDKICKMLDKKLAEYRSIQAMNGDNLDLDDVIPSKRSKTFKDNNKINQVNSNNPRSDLDQHNEKDRQIQRARQKKPFCPKEGSGAYPILVTLKNNHTGLGSFMSRTELQNQAQLLCNTKMESDANNHYAAWSAMSKLIENGYVIKKSNPAKYYLTDPGLALAIALSEGDSIVSGDTVKININNYSDSETEEIAMCRDKSNNYQSKNVCSKSASVPTSNSTATSSSTNIQFTPLRTTNKFIQDFDLEWEKKQTPVMINNDQNTSISKQKGFDIDGNKNNLENDQVIFCKADDSSDSEQSFCHKIDDQEFPKFDLDHSLKDLSHSAYDSKLYNYHLDFTNSMSNEQHSVATEVTREKLFATKENPKHQNRDSFDSKNQIPIDLTIESPPLSPALNKLVKNDFNSEHSLNLDNNINHKMKYTPHELSKTSNTKSNCEVHLTLNSPPSSNVSPTNSSNQCDIITLSDSDDDSDIYDTCTNKPNGNLSAIEEKIEKSLRADLEQFADNDYNEDMEFLKFCKENKESSVFNLHKKQSNFDLTALLIDEDPNIENHNFGINEEIQEYSPNTGILTTTPTNLSENVNVFEEIPLEDHHQPVTLPQSFESLFNLFPYNFDIILIVDNGETKGKTVDIKEDELKTQLFSKGIKYEVRSLKVGDFSWVAQCKTTHREVVLPYIIERKRINDLSKSIMDSRFHEQKYRLKRSGIKNVIYLIEKMSGQKYTGALPLTTLSQAAVNTSVRDNFNIKYTKDKKDTIEYLSIMTTILIEMYQAKELIAVKKTDIEAGFEDEQKHAEKLMEFSEFNTASAKMKNFKIKDMFLRQLVQLSGLSAEGAAAVVHIYPTPLRLYKAFQTAGPNGEKLLCNINYGSRKIGPTISKALYLFYTTRVPE